MGSNKKPFFRIVVADSRRNNCGLFLEQVGWYDPKKKSNDCEIQLDRVDYWVGKGAQLTDTVRNLAKRVRKATAAAPAVASAPAAQ